VNSTKRCPLSDGTHSGSILLSFNFNSIPFSLHGYGMAMDSLHDHGYWKYYIAWLWLICMAMDNGNSTFHGYG
jgi:hypothetical protein